MATWKKIKLPSIQGIVPGSPAGTVGTFTLPLGYRYANLQLVYIDGGSSPNDMLAMFDDVLVYKNTKAQRTHNATELNRLNSINGSQYAYKKVNTGAAQRQSLFVHFLEPWRKNPVDTDASAWNVSPTDNWNNFQATIKLLDDMPSTATLIAYAWVSDLLALPAGQTQAIKKVYRANIPASGTSIDVTTLDDADNYQTILLKNPTTGYISQASLKRGGVTYIDQVMREDNIAHLASQNLNPNDSTTSGEFGYEIVLDADDPVNNALPVNASNTLWLQLGFNTAAAGNVVGLIERVGAAD